MYSHIACLRCFLTTISSVLIHTRCIMEQRQEWFSSFAAPEFPNAGRRSRQQPIVKVRKQISVHKHWGILLCKWWMMTPITQSCVCGTYTQTHTPNRVNTYIFFWIASHFTAFNPFPKLGEKTYWYNPTLSHIPEVLNDKPMVILFSKMHLKRSANKLFPFAPIPSTLLWTNWQPNKIMFYNVFFCVATYDMLLGFGFNVKSLDFGQSGARNQKCIHFSAPQRRQLVLTMVTSFSPRHPSWNCSRAVGWHHTPGQR